MVQTLKFKVIAGKTPKEMLAAMAEGNFEAYRLPIPGGHEVTLARRQTANIGGVKKNMLLLDHMPPEELLKKEVPVQDVKVDRPNEPSRFGKYGICDNRKFFFETGKPAAKEPTASKPRKTN